MNKLATTIGNNQNSDPEEVKNIRKKLNSIGIDSGHDDRGYIDRDLDQGIREFQRGMNLKEDGIIKPEGETETRLNHVLQLIQDGKIVPPKPKRKPEIKKLPIPGRKDDAIIKNHAKKRADALGELGAGLFTKGIKRAPVKTNKGKGIKNTVSKNENFISNTISNIFDSYFEYMIRKNLKNEEDNK